MTTNKKYAAPTGERSPKLAFAGQQGWQRMKPADDVELGRQLRQAAWEVASRTSVTGVRRDRLVLATLRNRFGAAAVDRFGAEAVIALLRQPGPGMCNWCAARVLHATASPPKPTPTPTPTAALTALLGAQCGRCRVAFEAREIGRRESEHVEAVTAAGMRPQAAANLRTPEQVAAYRRSLESLTNAKLPPRPTGAIWPAGREPQGLTAAARAAAQRRLTDTDTGRCPCERCQARRGR